MHFAQETSEVIIGQLEVMCVYVCIHRSATAGRQGKMLSTLAGQAPSQPGRGVLSRQDVCRDAQHGWKPLALEPAIGQWQPWHDYHTCLASSAGDAPRVPHATNTHACRYALGAHSQHLGHGLLCVSTQKFSVQGLPSIAASVWLGH